MILEYLAGDWRVQLAFVVAAGVTAVASMMMSRSVKAQQLETDDRAAVRVHEREMWTVKQGAIAIEHRKSDP